MTGPVGTKSSAGRAAEVAAGTIDGLREACLSIEAAVDRANESLSGVRHPLPQLTLTTWHDAIDQAWVALGLVRVGLAEAGNLDGVRPVSVGVIVEQLRAARQDAELAVSRIGPLRRQLATAEDLTRHADATAGARATAATWRMAIARLDLVAGRLGAGIGALDQYLTNLVGSGSTPGPSQPPPLRPAVPVDTANPPGNAGSAETTRTAGTADTAAGARAAGAAVLAVHPYGGWRGFLARGWHEYRKENRFRCNDPRRHF